MKYRKSCFVVFLIFGMLFSATACSSGGDLTSQNNLTPFETVERFHMLANEGSCDQAIEMLKFGSNGNDNLIRSLENANTRKIFCNFVTRGRTIDQLVFVGPKDAYVPSEKVNLVKISYVVIFKNGDIFPDSGYLRKMGGVWRIVATPNK